jgi:hypothetical protein
MISLLKVEEGDDTEKDTAGFGFAGCSGLCPAVPF